MNLHLQETKKRGISKFRIKYTKYVAPKKGSLIEVAKEEENFNRCYRELLGDAEYHKKMVKETQIALKSFFDTLPSATKKDVLDFMEKIASIKGYILGEQFCSRFRNS
jgi:uncharacterized protein YutD